MRVPHPRWLLTFGAFGAAAICVGRRFELLRHHGRDLPFHDQWDAELLHLLRPWLHGEELLPFLFRFHNEHHPVFTKLIALATTTLDGTWSALPVLVFNALLQAITVFLVGRLAQRHLPPWPALAATACAGVVLGLPLLWENALWAFQSQFYLAALLGLLHVQLIWSRPTLGWRWFGGALAGFATLGTIAAAFLAVTASGLVAAVRLRGDRANRPHAAATFAFAIIVTVAGLMLVRPVPHSAHARDLWSALEAAGLLLRWPFAAAAGTIWALVPLAILLAGELLGTRRAARPALLAAMFWLTGILAAFAYGRAEFITGATTRYCDFLALHLLVGLVVLLTWAAAQQARRRVAFAAVAVWTALGAGGFFIASRDTHAPAARATLQDAQTSLVQSYTRAGREDIFRQSLESQLLHDSPEQRRTLLTDASVRTILPPSVRPPLPIRPAEGTTGFTRESAREATEYLEFWTTTTDGGKFVSDLLTPGSLPLARLRIRGGLDGRSHRLWLEAADGRVLAEPLGTVAADAERTINITLPAEPFRLRAEATADSSSFAFSAPVETGRLSWLAGKAFRSGGMITTLGALSLFASALLLWRTPPSPANQTIGAPMRDGAAQLGLAMGGIAVALSLFVWPNPFTWSAVGRDQKLFSPDDAPTFDLAQADAENFGRAFLPYGADAESFLFGSYPSDTGDAAFGRLTTPAFPLDGRWLALPFAGHPEDPKCSLAIEFLNSSGAVLRTVHHEGPGAGLRPDLWINEVQPGETSARILATDQAGDHGGWLAIGNPWTTHALPDRMAWRAHAAANRLHGLRYGLLVVGITLVVISYRARRHASGGWLWPDRAAV